MDKVKIIEAIDRPKDMSETDELAWILGRVLRWPTPRGTVMDYCLPGWLADDARRALRRYINSGKSLSTMTDKITNIEITKDHRGEPAATGFCVACDRDRSLDVVSFTGMLAISCQVCGATQGVSQGQS